MTRTREASIGGTSTTVSPAPPAAGPGGYDTAQAVLESMRAEVERSGSPRGLFTTFATLGLLSVRLGALPEADAAARIALRVLEGLGFDRGLRLLASVLIDIGIEAGQLDEADQFWLCCARPSSQQSSAR